LTYPSCGQQPLLLLQLVSRVQHRCGGVFVLLLPVLEEWEGRRVGYHRSVRGRGTAHCEEGKESSEHLAPASESHARHAQKRAAPLLAWHGINLQCSTCFVRRAFCGRHCLLWLSRESVQRSQKKQPPRANVSMYVSFPSKSPSALLTCVTRWGGEGGG
jgi:hypothetical protein